MDCSSFQLSVDLVLRVPDLVVDLDLVLWLGGSWLWSRHLSGRSTSQFTLKISPFRLAWKRKSEHR